MPASLTPNDAEPETVDYYVIEKDRLETLLLDAWLGERGAVGYSFDRLAKLKTSVQSKLEEMSEGRIYELTHVETCRGPDGSNLCTLPRFHEGDCDPKERPEADAPELIGTTNARAWAQAFCDRFRITREEGDSSVDDPEGLMLGWFANAIEAGRAAGAKTERDRIMRKSLATRYQDLHQVLTDMSVSTEQAMERIDRIFEKGEEG